MEHAHPLRLPYPWRTLALAASVIALGAGSVVALAHRPIASSPAAAPRERNAPALPPQRPRSRISVLVLNGNGASGVAGSTATNAANDGYATSLVLYRPGWAPEARRLAKDAGIKVVAALDGRLPPGSARAQLVLILGAK